MLFTVSVPILHSAQQTLNTIGLYESCSGFLDNTHRHLPRHQYLSSLKQPDFCLQSCEEFDTDMQKDLELYNVG